MPVASSPSPPSSTTEHDDRLRRALLEHALGLYPAWLTAEELGLALAAADDDRDRALRDLEADGLLHRRAGFLLPTRAAVSCAALLSERRPSRAGARA